MEILECKLKNQCNGKPMRIRTCLLQEKIALNSQCDNV